MECSYEKAVQLAKSSFDVDEWFGNLEALRKHQ